MFLIVMLINWAFKLLMAFLFYSLAVWLGAPEWLVIAVTAIAACESHIKWEVKYG